MYGRFYERLGILGKIAALKPIHITHPNILENVGVFDTLNVWES